MKFEIFDRMFDRNKLYSWLRAAYGVASLRANRNAGKPKRVSINHVSLTIHCCLFRIWGFVSTCLLFGAQCEYLKKCLFASKRPLKALKKGKFWPFLALLLSAQAPPPFPGHINVVVSRGDPSQNIPNFDLGGEGAQNTEIFTLWVSFSNRGLSYNFSLKIIWESSIWKGAIPMQKRVNNSRSLPWYLDRSPLPSQNITYRLYFFSVLQ